MITFVRQRTDYRVRPNSSASRLFQRATGVHSAKPTVVTGSEDATVNRTPPGQEKEKDFDLNYDPAKRNENSSN